MHGRDLRAIQERLRRGPPSSPGGRRPTLDGDPKPVALDVAVHVVLCIAEALAHAHARSDREGRPLRLVHRDVSPSNILVSFDGAVKLLDFGIARVGLPSHPPRLVRTDTGQVKGTVGYMSPEQVDGEPVDARSDIYSLGVCLWELCTGRRLLEALEPASARISVPDAAAAAAAAQKLAPLVAAQRLPPLTPSVASLAASTASLAASASQRLAEPRVAPSPRAFGAAVSPEARSHHLQGARAFPRGAVPYRNPLSCRSLPASARRGRARGPCSRCAICAKSVPRSRGGGSRIP